MMAPNFLLAITLLSLCWAIAAADEDESNLNTINDTDDTTLFYDFEGKIDKLVESVEQLQKSNEYLTSELKLLKQAKDQNPLMLSTKMEENWNANLNVLEVKCPNNRFPENCFEVNECTTNVYNIMVPNYSNHSLAVSCDFKTADGGWTVIQRRKDGSVNFYRNWTDYVEGFGNVDGEFFIGLEKLHFLTAQQDKPQELYIILEDFEGEQRYAKYQTFSIDSKDNDYKITVGNYSGNAGDSLTYHNGQKFSTWDRDNDMSNANCAKAWRSAWWYDKCYHSNLNGNYLMGKLYKSNKNKGISWEKFRGYEYSLKFTQMMIRPQLD